MSNQRSGIVIDRGNCQTHPNACRICRVAKSDVQVSSVNGDAGSSLAPHGGGIDFGQQATSMIIKALSSNRSTTRFDVGVNLQRTQGAQCVPGQIQAHADIAPLRVALNDVGGASTSPQREAQPEPCNACTDNEYFEFPQIQGPPARDGPTSCRRRC
jgi:hypothetical protein